MLRHRMAEMVSVGEVAAVHSAPQALLGLGANSEQGRDRWEEALERGVPLWGIGEVFLVDSTNLDSILDI